MGRKNIFTENVDNIAGKRLQELRLSQGKSRQQLAEKIGVTHQQLQKYENGSNRMSFGRICLIAKILGKPLSYFNDGSDFENESIISSHARMAMDISKNFMKISSFSNQYAAAQLVKILAENK